jgi:hypothetical protein
LRLNGGMQNLMSQPDPTRLPSDPEAERAVASVTDLASAQAAAAQFPASSATWARLAELSLAAKDPVAAYAYARTGYHRGLDQLRRNGWKGSGPVPWSHEPNQGFLRALRALGQAADEIGESDEAARCAQFLHDCDPSLG